MKTRVLLLRPRYSTLISPFSAYGLLTIGSIIKKMAHTDVKIIDNNSLYKFYSDDDLFQIIEEYNPEIVGININIMNAYNSYDFINQLKQKFPSVMILAGGIHSYNNAKEIALKSACDVVIKGEADITIQKLIKQFQMDKKSDFSNITGLIINGHDTGPTELLTDLDQLPFIDYSIYNLDDFVKYKQDHHFITNVVINQRGCPYTCTFCSADFLHSRYRRHSPQYVAKHIEHLYSQNSYHSFFIADNNFTLNTQWAMEVCQEIKRRGLNKLINFEFQTNIKCNFSDALLKELYGAGFRRIEFGIERLTDDGMTSVHKYVPYEEIVERLEKIRYAQYPFELFTNILLGFSFATLDSLKRELTLFTSVKSYFDAIGVKFLAPIPGTKEYSSNIHLKGVREWYLQDSFTKLKTSFFQMAMFDYTGAYFLNYFNLDRKILREVIAIQIHFINHTIRSTNQWLIIPRYFELILVFLSLILFRISPSIENFVFYPVVKLRFFLMKWIYAKLFNEMEQEIFCSKELKGHLE
ncbi:MAG: radical SAM protein [Oligoflexia bacterium]|nr:radical SAM protein [Oligoflexia bacterium]